VTANPNFGKLIDVHCHVIPDSFPDNPSPERNTRWPCLKITPQSASLIIDGKPFRDVDARSWNVARRIDDMDRDGVAVQVLSPLPELLSYWFEDADALSMCDHVNAVIARMVAQHPDRFRGLGLVPLQKPELAARYLERIKTEFGFAGIEIGSNINGVPLGDARFESVYEAAQALSLAIFVHALHPVATKAIGADPGFTALAGFPLDTGMAAASILLVRRGGAFSQVAAGLQPWRRHDRQHAGAPRQRLRAHQRLWRQARAKAQRTGARDVLRQQCL
jgi:aminocarboxymuconate-semialdehyde decarboxylase